MKFVKEKEGKKGFWQRLLNVTWNEILEAEKEGEKEMEFELTDIFEEAKPSNIDFHIEDNIEYILKREGLLPEGAKVVVPAGWLHWDCEEEFGKCSYVTGFEVYDETGRHVIARGDAYGDMLLYETKEGEEEYELLDMTTAIPIEELKALKSRVEPIPTR